MNYLSLLPQVLPLLNQDTASKIQANLPKILAAAIEGAAANAGGGTQAMEIGAATAALGALFTALQGK